MLSAIDAAFVLQLQQRRSRLDSRLRGMFNKKNIYIKKTKIQLLEAINFPFFGGVPIVGHLFY